jgi:hypothetical protein
VLLQQASGFDRRFAAIFPNNSDQEKRTFRELPHRGHKVAVFKFITANDFIIKTEGSSAGMILRERIVS